MTNNVIRYVREVPINRWQSLLALAIMPSVDPEVTEGATGVERAP